MAFEFFERSRNKGSPIELYRFKYGPWETDIIGYTDGEERVELDGTVYVPVPIKRGSFSVSGTMDKSSLEVTVAPGAEVTELFRVYPPGQVVTLTILRGHREDVEKDYRSIWIGRVLSCSFGPDDNRLACEPMRTTLQRVGLRRHYQYMCPHVLYGPQCRASEANATRRVQIDSVDGRLIVVTGSLASASYYGGGVIRWTDELSRVNARTIVSATTGPEGGRLLLSGLARGLEAGMTVEALYGCAHNVNACKNVHNNIENYGGYPFIPTKNPLGIYGAFT